MYTFSLVRWLLGQTKGGCEGLNSCLTLSTVLTKPTLDCLKLRHCFSEYFFVDSSLITKIMSQNHLKIEHQEIRNRCHAYQNVRRRCHLQWETLSEVYVMYKYTPFMNIPGGSEVRYRQFMATWTNFWTQNQSDLNGKPVQLLEVLWQYYVHCGPKHQFLVNKGHRDGQTWLWYAIWQ